MAFKMGEWSNIGKSGFKLKSSWLIEYSRTDIQGEASHNFQNPLCSPIWVAWFVSRWKSIVTWVLLEPNMWPLFESRIMLEERVIHELFMSSDQNMHRDKWYVRTFNLSFSLPPSHTHTHTLYLSRSHTLSLSLSLSPTLSLSPLLERIRTY